MKTASGVRTLQALERIEEDLEATRRERLPHIGDVVGGKYRLERVIGQGAMGAVFQAHHQVLHKKVALKVMSSEHTGAGVSRSRFFNEARAAAALESDHVGRVLDVGELEDGAFMALELLQGADLERVLGERGPLPIHDVVDWVLQALEALAEAHALGIVHRDLKPANLFLADRRDGTRIVKVLDFGIAKQTRPVLYAPSITATSLVLGSPAYMAPEQLRDARAVDARTDQWGIGVVLYELLTGRLPFSRQDFAELLVAIFQEDPPPPRAARADVPVELESVILRCLARDPAGRFRDVVELAEALAPFAVSGVHPSVERIRHVTRTAMNWTQPAKAPIARRRRLDIVAAAIAISIGAATIGFVASRHAPRTEHGPLPGASARADLAR